MGMFVRMCVCLCVVAHSGKTHLLAPVVAVCGRKSVRLVVPHAPTFTQNGSPGHACAFTH